MRRRLLSVSIFVLAFLAAPFYASALTISPARLEISGDPGQTLEGEVLLFDETLGENQIKTYYISYENFEPRGDSGAPFFVGAKDGLATWINTQDAVSINSSGEFKVPFSITIPADAKPGGYFAAIFFGTQPPASSSGQVSVGGKVGMLILLRVNGEIEESGGLLSFSTKNNARVITTPPVVLEYRLNNSGGDRVVPRGTVRLLNTFRFTVDEVDANKNQGSVLPGSARRYEVFLGEERSLDDNGNPISLSFFETVRLQLSDFKFGWYTAKLDISWGQSNQTAEDSYHFFIIPWQALVVLFSGLFIIWKVLKLLLRKYNAWILAQAGLNRENTPQTKSINEETMILQNKIVQKNTSERPLPASKSRIQSLSKEKAVLQKPLQKPKRKI